MKMGQLLVSEGLLFAHKKYPELQIKLIKFSLLFFSLISLIYLVDMSEFGLRFVNYFYAFLLAFTVPFLFYIIPEFGADNTSLFIGKDGCMLQIPNRHGTKTTIGSFTLKWNKIESIATSNKPLQFMSYLRTDNIEIVITANTKKYTIQTAEWELSEKQEKRLSNFKFNIIPQLENYDAVIMQKIIKYYYSNIKHHSEELKQI
jgi:hypothetical protein